MKIKQISANGFNYLIMTLLTSNDIDIIVILVSYIHIKENMDIRKGKIVYATKKYMRF